MRRMMALTAGVLLWYLGNFSIANVGEYTNQDLIKAFNSPSLNETIQNIAEYKTINNIAMPLKVFEDLITQKKLNVGEARAAYIELMGSQDPIINKEQLKELYKAKIESISNFYCEYSSTLEKDGKASLKRNIFAFDGDKVFAEIRDGPNQNSLQVKTRSSFNGSTWQNMQLNNEATLTDTTADDYAGEITKQSLRKSIYISNDYLKYCSLAMTPNGMQAIQAFDLVAFLEQDLTTVQEKLVNEDGRNYLVVADVLREYYLDPKMDFATTKFVDYEYSSEANYSQKEIAYQRTMSDFADCGNSIWIPQKITQTNVKYDQEESIVLTSYKINTTLEDSMFDNIFPDGILVKNQILEVAYITGYPKVTEAHLDDLLDAKVYSKVKTDNESLAKSLTENTIKPEPENDVHEISKEGEDSSATPRLMMAVIIICILSSVIFVIVRKREETSE